jgi:hypothetical protein
MLEALLAERRGGDRPAQPDAMSPAPPNDEDRPKAAAWEALRRDGLIGRFDAEPINAVRFYTELYRRYVGRRPTQEELKPLRTGPGYEQWMAEPETIIRRLFQSDWFAATPLGRALLDAPHLGSDRVPAISP